MSSEPIADPYSDLAAFTCLPRITGLAVAPDGSRLVATVQQPDAKGARYITSLWTVPLDASVPTRLTRGDKGETSPVFRPDSTLLFVAARPDPESENGATADEAALWALPQSGEPYMIARRPGGLDGPVVAAGSGTVVVTGSRLTGSTDADDGDRRRTRRERNTSAILHTGMPIRYWDHELGDATTRLLLLAEGSDEPVDLLPHARFELTRADVSISSDGRRLATTWRPRGAHGQLRDQIAVLDLGGARTDPQIVAADDGWDFLAPAISPNGTTIAAGRERVARFDIPLGIGLTLLPADGGDRRDVDLGDITPTEWAWAPDSRTLYVAGDLHGRGAIIAVDPVDGRLRAELATDASYSSLAPAPDGVLYALRSTIDSPPTPVRLDTASAGQPPTPLPSPAAVPPPPGRLVEIAASAADGTPLRTWLCLPQDTDRPAPVMLWVHGGPFSSFNTWSWRWNPWVATARGWAVVMPDPALSTGYGQGFVDRAWPYLADVVWDDLERVLDAALERPDVDPSRVALAGASFGGFMTNWIAGHTDRFGAIVTHAGLWALDQQHATTDAADYKTGVFGTLAEHPEWYERYSPHNRADHITSPMLVIHGNRDYRVPVSEALRLWWDLVSRHDGPPETLPHRFLQFTDQNHWMLKPADAEIWFDTVLGFCAQHVLGETWSPSALL